MLYQAQEELYGRRPVFEMPVQLNIEFSDGTDTTITVWNDQQLQQFDFTTDKQIVFVTVDQDKWILRKSYFKTGLPVSLNEPKEINDISIYPNPFNDKLFVNVLNPSILPFELTLYNIMGKVVSTQSISTIQMQLNMGKLKQGTYLYSISGGKINLPFNGKIIKR
jgi:hypothetical protein